MSPVRAGAKKEAKLSVDSGILVDGGQMENINMGMAAENVGDERVPQIPMYSGSVGTRLDDLVKRFYVLQDKLAPVLRDEGLSNTEDRGRAGLTPLARQLEEIDIHLEDLIYNVQNVIEALEI